MKAAAENLGIAAEFAREAERHIADGDMTAACVAKMHAVNHTVYAAGAMGYDLVPLSSDDDEAA